ncbi:unnamed protein product [Urochloa humidicola]
MAMIRDPMPALSYDEAFIDGSSHTSWEEGLFGRRPWELPMVGSSCTFGQDGVWPNMAAGVSSSSPSSSSVVTFDGHGDEYYFASNSFSFGGDTGSGEITATGASQKRPRGRVPSQGAEEEAAAAPPKKQCAGNRRAATKPNKAPKDPQNLAAKNRRERISERLRALQELVPNGSKVDTVTMLEKAITYVRFMQLQLKVLETDAFWPAPYGGAPMMSQVKEALDAILLSVPFL